jgi:hypothetical protein
MILCKQKMKPYVVVAVLAWIGLCMWFMTVVTTPRVYNHVLPNTAGDTVPSCKPASWFAIEADPRLAMPFTPGKLRVFAFADGDKQGVCSLARTLRGDAMLHVLGFRNSNLHLKTGERMSSYMKKLLWMRHVAQEAHVDDILLFLDAFDSVAQHNVSLVIPRYTEAMRGRRGVLFQGEANCFPFDISRPRGGGWSILHNDDICVHTPPLVSEATAAAIGK